MVAVRANGEVVPYQYRVNDMYVDEIQAFVDSVAGKRSPDPDGKEARRSLAIGMAVLESAETGNVVTLG